MVNIKKLAHSVKLHDYNGDLKKEWYIGIRYTNIKTGVRKHFQVRLGINYYHTLKARKSESKLVLSLVEEALSNGWNPFEQKIEEYLQETTFKEELEALEKEKQDQERTEKYGLMNSLWNAFESKKRTFAHKTSLCIAGVLRFANTAAIQLNISTKLVQEITRKDIKELLDQIAINRQKEYDRQKKNIIFSGNSYNKYKEYLKLLFSDLEERDIIEFNPCSKIRDRKEIKTNIHRHATQKERDLIVLELKKSENINFYYFVALIHATGLRPKELLALTIKDIDSLNKSVILDYSESKTGHRRIVPIPDYIFNYLIELVNGLPLSYYIFGHNFKPSKFKKKREYPTRIWKELIKDNLKIDVSLYSMKGLGGDEKRDAGIAIGAISAGFGHASTNMTLTYLHGEQDRINKELREKTPEL